MRLARTPTFDRLWATCPHAFLRTSGLDVGLPDGQMGNSEVGHMNIGAGRVVMQDLPRIGQAIADGSIATAPALVALIAALQQSGGTCHLMGLVSPGGVHSHQDHAAALAAHPGRAPACRWRRTPSPTGATRRRNPAARISRRFAGRPAGGRAHRHRLRPLLRHGPRQALGPGGEGLYGRGGRPGRRASPTPVAAVDAAYAEGVTDEFVIPAVIGDYAGMRDGDGILCFNFRADRVRELLGALTDPDFAGFARPRPIRFAAAAGMTHYSDELAQRLGILFPPESLANLLGQVVARAGRTQLRMAETEKYPHVTYFLNGGEETPNPGEDRIMVPSPKVATYDLQPEMSAPELTDKAVAPIASGKYDLIVLNFANPDMVGHTGSLPAAIKAVETVDAGLGRILAAVERQGGALLVTADHGNCELMRDPETGGPHTAHTTNPVPVMLAGTAVTTPPRRAPWPTSRRRCWR